MLCIDRFQDINISVQSIKQILCWFIMAASFFKCILHILVHMLLVSAVFPLWDSSEKITTTINFNDSVTESLIIPNLNQCVCEMTMNVCLKEFHLH